MEQPFGLGNLEQKGGSEKEAMFRLAQELEGKELGEFTTGKEKSVVQVFEAITKKTATL